MQAEKRAKDNTVDEDRHPARLRFLVGLVLALVIVTVLIMSVNPGAEGKEDVALSQAMLSEKTGLEIDSQGLATRVVEQKFQIHMEEMDQEMGEIPYVEVWVLNDPFYPLIGTVGDLKKTEGFLSSKEWQMLGFPVWIVEEEEQGATPTPVPVTTTGQDTGATTAVGATQRVLMVKEIYELRGIRYANIKVNDQSYDKLKAGSEFAEVFKVQEIKDNQTVIILCGDETYELKVNQLRKI